MSSYDWSVWVPPGAKQFMAGPSTSLGEIRQEPAIAKPSEKLSRKVFIVHGHDLKSRDEISLYLLGWGLEPVVLSEQSEEGMVLIEKFEKNTVYVKYAIVLLTPDDIFYSKNGKKIKPRARQNVILELGYFWGKLGRQKVCCLVKGDVDEPSDMYGIVFLKYKRRIEEIKERIKKELKTAGYEIEDPLAGYRKI